MDNLLTALRDSKVPNNSSSLLKSKNNFKGEFLFNSWHMMSSAGSDHENEYSPNHSPEHKSIRNGKNFMSYLNNQSLSQIPQELNMKEISELHQQAEKDLKAGRIETALEKFYVCIDQAFVAANRNPSDPEFSAYFVETLKFLNENALYFLKEDKIGVSLRILEISNEITGAKKYGVFPSIQSLTYNNLACCYRRMGKLEVALKYLERALGSLANTDERENAGITHINLCAIYSQMGK